MTPCKLRETIVQQCGKDVVPEEIEYFEQATKHWIHNRLDMTDVWDKINNGAKITLWCMRNDSTSSGKSRCKRANLDDENDSDKKKLKLSNSKALAEEHEQELKEAW